MKIFFLVLCDSLIWVFIWFKFCYDFCYFLLPVGESWGMAD
jgi:hypothetical protein